MTSAGHDQVHPERDSFSSGDPFGAIDEPVPRVTRKEAIDKQLLIAFHDRYSSDTQAIKSFVEGIICDNLTENIIGAYQDMCRWM